MTAIKGDITPLPGKVLVRDLQFGERKTTHGLIITDDDGKNRGIHPRWAQIWRLGEGVENVSVGDWVLVAHGRWSRSVVVEDETETFKINLIDFPDGVLLVGNRPTNDVYTDITK